MTNDNDKDRMRFYGIAMVFVLVISTALLLAATLAKKGQAQDAVLPMVAAGVLAVFAARFLGDAWEKVKNGIPLEDERALRLKDKAGGGGGYKRDGKTPPPRPRGRPAAGGRLHA